MANRAKRYADIGNNIKVLRKETGYTQKELAEKVNKSESAIRMWELGFSEPDIDTINLLSEVFHVNVGAITGKEAKEERRLPSNISPIPKQKEPAASMDGEPEENVIIFHRNGKTQKKKFTKEQMAMFMAMVDAIPDTDEDL